MELKLVNIANPKIYIVAPKDCINEVSGNCWQINSSQPLTFAKSLWKLSNNISQQSRDRITLFKIATILSQYEDKDGSPLEQTRDIVRDATINALED